MNDVWFGSDLSPRDFDVILKSLSLLGREPSLIAVAEDGTRLALASRALFKLFGAENGEALGDRLLRAQDPGSRRLVALAQQLAVDGAPRLERLRFFIGPASEVVTFLCRRVLASNGRPLFIAAALGLPTEVVPTGPRQEGGGAQDVSGKQPARDPVDPDPDGIASGATAVEAVERAGASRSPLADPMGVQAILATLRSRWPSSGSVRFLWQTDADHVCTEVGSPLPAIVGSENGDVVGCSFAELAGRLDGTGRLSACIAAEKTWSGVDVLWPIGGSSAAVEVGLGAMPMFDRDRVFEGYRGYGIIRLDRILPHEAVQLRSTLVARPVPAGNVVSFPGTPDGKALSPEDQQTFRTLGAELRDKVGFVHPAAPPGGAEPPSAAMQPEADGGVHAGSDGEPHARDEGAADHAAADTATAGATSAEDGAVVARGDAAPEADHAAEIARNALGLIQRLAVALLVSRDNVPIFANRCFLEMTGFADEDELHAAGGMAHLFGGLPGNNSGAETVCLRARDGTIVVAAARMQRIDWEGLPATLLTLQQLPAGVRGSTAEEGARAPTELPAEEIGRSFEDETEMRELRAILETATDGVAVIDGDCNVVSLNRSGEALFGCDRQAVIGKPFLDLFAADNQGLAADYFEGLKSSATKRLLNDGREIMIKAHQGGTIPVFMTLGRLGPSSNGETAGDPRFCALFRDLTPWKKVERELEGARNDAERASALKSDFLARVSHEVRTPLTAIIGFAETMLEERFGAIGNERYKEYLRDIQSSGSHVMSLVNELLDLSKIEAGKMDLAVDPLDVNKVVAEGVALMQPQASRERVIMRLSLAPNVPQIRADRRALHQIVLNILSNAVKYNEPGGQVIVATAMTEAGCVVIRIRDTGPGMSEQDVATALEPFRQLATVRSVTPGTGLGLPLTKALVEANEAVFTIRSKLNQGTLVEVSFPPARVLARQGNA